MPTIIMVKITFLILSVEFRCVIRRKTSGSSQNHVLYFSSIFHVKLNRKFSSFNVVRLPTAIYFIIEKFLYCCIGRNRARGVWDGWGLENSTAVFTKAVFTLLTHFAGHTDQLWSIACLGLHLRLALSLAAACQLPILSLHQQYLFKAEFSINLF